MKCIQLFNRGRNNEPQSQNSIQSSFTDHERGKQSDSGLNSTSESDHSNKSRGRTKLPNLQEGPNSLRVFTFLELKQMTKNFSVSTKLGEGGFGSVYKGIMKSSEDPGKKQAVAVKQLGKRGLQGHKEWVTEVNVLGVVEHPNLVKLIGYCAEDDERGMQRLLIYEYMPNGSVEDHLSVKSTTPLSWAMRLRIALDAAKGLAYLHEEMDFQIIFRDFKSSNILLDEQWNSKLSDFGLARLGPEEGLTHISTAVVGTMGYAAPEYIRTGHLTSKSDVWSYGVFLYELITGRRPLDRNRPRSEQRLLEWVKPYLSDAKKFKHILDPRLEVKQTLKSAHKLSLVANRCLARQSKTRPKMSEVLEMVRQVVDMSAGAANSQLPLKTKDEMKTFKDSNSTGHIQDGGWSISVWLSKLRRRFLDI
ncbi:putative receptor-like protein kinase-like [Dorcoceras hygrometricum]|uniref:non-specific serine/threonine protein kinase n=1 Tax=Dorcoceras hygrometricum TaxID=472368 RepID=A0A2Z7AXI6_9LAMI|nr:putative receptor-like protein kinase-like [Dorcoceras hygrometricum]